jgi:hypothetical protein
MKNISDHFSELEVNEELHTYTHQSNNLIPVTKLLQNFVPEFDKEGKSKSVAKKRGVSQQEILDEWEKTGSDARNFGHSVHQFAYDYGQYYVGTGSLPVPTCPEMIAIVKFFKELNPRFLPVAFEQKVYSLKYQYAGTADIVFFDGKKGFIICDYKTGKNIHKNYMGQMMLSPFHYLLDTPFNHYQLQLSLYQIPLEEHGYFVSERWVVWAKSDGTYQKLNTHNFTQMLKQHISQ